VYNRRLRALLQRCAAGFALAAFLVAAAALPAEAHTTGPQLVSHFDGFFPASPGVEYTILSTGSAPYVTAAVRGPHVFEVFGLQGEPFIRIAADGVSLNRNSPSLYLTRDPSKKPAAPPAAVSQTPAWEKVSEQPVLHYWETRAEWPHTGQPDEARRIGRPATVFRFAIPASYDGGHVAIQGHVTWIPAPINLEIPLLFVPLVVVGLLWIEPKARPYVRQIARGVAVAVLVAVALDAARSILDLRSPGSETAGLAPLAVIPGLVLTAAVAVPRLLRADRRAYAWVLTFGAYLLVFGLLRPALPSSACAALEPWLRRGELVVGLLVAAGAGLLLFLSSPLRHSTRQGRSSRAGARRAAFD